MCYKTIYCRKSEGVEDQEEDVSSDWINLRTRDYSGN